MAVQELPDFLAEQEDEQQAFLDSFGFGEPPKGNPGELDAYISKWIRRVADIEAELNQNEQAAAAEIRDIEAWRDARNAPLERRRGWIVSHLQGLARTYNFFGRKSRELAAGRFGWRSTSDSVDFVDMAAAVAFAEQNGLEVKVSKSVGKKPLLRHLRATGELADGVEFVPAEDRFFVSPAENGKDGAA